jgi:hypothetical protein
MKRIDPTFKLQTVQFEQDLTFIDELFDELFDNDNISENTDKIPNLDNELV